MIDRSHPYWFTAQLLEWVEIHCAQGVKDFARMIKDAFTYGEPFLIAVAAVVHEEAVPIPRWYFDELESVSDMDDEDDVEILDFLRPYVVDDDPYAADAA